MPMARIILNLPYYVPTYKLATGNEAETWNISDIMQHEASGQLKAADQQLTCYNRPE